MSIIFCIIKSVSVMKINIPNTWDEKRYHNFIRELLSIEDAKYKEFSSKLIPNTKNKIIGIRIPELRKFSKEIYKNNYEEFLKYVKSDYMEEILIEGFLIGLIKDQYIADKYIETFITKVDNWCVCDTFCSSLKIVRKNMQKYFNFFTKNIDFDEPFQIRVSLMILNAHYINNEYIDKIFEYVNSIKSNHYYVQMGIAWLISTCYIKFRKETLLFLKNNNLNDFTYNKSIQKMIESKRIPIEEKCHLRKLKR